MLMPVIRPDGRLYYPCLESKQAEIPLPDFPSYELALAEAHIFCHMALFLLQRHPLQALAEGGAWRRIRRI
jgi:hypothetical protein